MKIILSRKGFDSGPENGGRPSPIFPDDTLISLPIPARKTGNPLEPPYGELFSSGHHIDRLVADLTGGKMSAGDRAHLDPDLDSQCRSGRPAGWRPLFGQVAAAESHLRHQGVSAGDVFLFFGWFRDVKYENGRYVYVKDSPDRHVLFGWLQIEKRVRLGEGEKPPTWALGHAHNYAAGYSQANNSLYLAAPRLTLPGRDMNRPGGGRFNHYSPMLCLTATGSSRSRWRLPAWFHPLNGRRPLSYHGRPDRWTVNSDHVLLKTVGRGQEFVLDCEDYPEALDWLAALFHP